MITGKSHAARHRNYSTSDVALAANIQNATYDQTAFDTGDYLNMRDLITFYLSAKYRAPSKERLFLDMSWGIRDVSGPYLTKSEGLICIDNALLSKEFPSTMSLIFSISNRCPVASVLTRVSTQREVFSHHIERNGSNEFIIDSVYSSPQHRYVISVCLPEVGSLPDIRVFPEILSIDEITIERHH